VLTAMLAKRGRHAVRQQPVESEFDGMSFNHKQLLTDLRLMNFATALASTSGHQR